MMKKFSSVLVYCDSLIYAGDGHIVGLKWELFPTNYEMLDKHWVRGTPIAYEIWEKIK